MDSSRKDDLLGFVDLVVPYLVEKLLEVWCLLLLLNIVYWQSLRGWSGGFARKALGRKSV